jgi:hypothetical protein
MQSSGARSVGSAPSKVSVSRSGRHTRPRSADRALSSPLSALNWIAPAEPITLPCAVRSVARLRVLCDSEGGEKGWRRDLRARRWGGHALAADGAPGGRAVTLAGFFDALSYLGFLRV